MNPKNNKSQTPQPDSGKPDCKGCFLTNFFKKCCSSKLKEVSACETQPKESLIQPKADKPFREKTKPGEWFKKRGKGKIFKLDERVGQEDLYTEFKNFSCAEIMKEQYKILTKLICSFLNTEGGKIFLGVDNSSYVKGRQFTKEGKKKFKNTLFKMISSFEPKPPEKSVKIKFHRILDEATQQLLDDRFIVVIKIKKGPIGTLFMDQEAKSYHRLDGQTRKYTPEEYHDELIVRNTQKESLEEYVQKEGKLPQKEGKLPQKEGKLPQKEGKLPEKKPEVRDEEKNASQKSEKGAIMSDIKNYLPLEEQQTFQKPFENEKDYLSNYDDYDDQAYENQRALEEAENYDAWYPEMYLGAENFYQTAPMGDCFREFIASQPIFYPQQMYPQQNFAMMYPQGHFFVQAQINTGNNHYVGQGVFNQQLPNEPDYDDRAEDDIKFINQLQEQQQLELLRKLEQQEQKLKEAKEKIGNEEDSKK